MKPVCNLANILIIVSNSFPYVQLPSLDTIFKFGYFFNSDVTSSASRESIMLIILFVSALIKIVP